MAPIKSTPNNRYITCTAPLIWHIYLLVCICGLFAAVWTWEAVLCLLLVLFFYKPVQTIPRLALAIIIFALAFAFSSWQFTQAEKIINNTSDWLDSKKCRITGTITFVQGLPEGRLRIILKNVRPVDLPESTLPGLVSWTWDNPDSAPLPGQQLTITRQIKPYAGFANNPNDSFRASLIAKDILWRMWSKANAGEPVFTGKPAFWAALRQKIKLDFQHLLNPDPAEPMPQANAILMSLIFGDRQFLSQQTANNFAAGALAHSLALSGQHLGIALLFSAITVAILNRLFSSLFLLRPRKLLVFLLAVPPACLYLWLGNAPPSLIRAAGMLVLVSFWIWRGYIFTGTDILASALCIILLANPLGIFDIGLQLSVICVLIIFLAVPFFHKINCLQLPHNASPYKRICVYLVNLLLLSLVIQIFLLPLNLARFQNPGYWFPLNIFWLPLLGFIVLPAAFTALLLGMLPFAHGLASRILAFAALPCDMLLDILDFLSAHGFFSFRSFLLPNWPYFIAFALLLVSVPVFLQRSPASGPNQLLKKLLTCSLVVLAMAPLARVIEYFNDGIDIAIYDVGQGQAIAIRFPGGTRILVDGGGMNSKRFDPGKALLAPQLLANSQPCLQAVFNSHPDLDHTGGLIHILDSLNTGKLFHNGAPAAGALTAPWQLAQQKPDSHSLQAGDRVYIGSQKNIYLDVLWPPATSAKNINNNNASLVLRLVRDGNGLALLTGDIEKSGLQEMIKKGADLRSMLVVAPHHGSDKNFLADLYLAARPELVAISCGSSNRYNYPGKKLQAALSRLNIPWRDTGKNGKISVTINPKLEMSFKTIK